MWVERFKKGGVAAFWNLPRRAGRPVESGGMGRIMGEDSGQEPSVTLQQDMRQKTGAALRITRARKSVRWTA